MKTKFPARFLTSFLILCSCNLENEKSNVESRWDSIQKDSVVLSHLDSDLTKPRDNSYETNIFYNGLNSIINDFKNQPSLYTIEGANQDIERLKKAWMKTLRPNETIELNDSLYKKITTANKILKTYQKKMFPKYRNIYTQASNEIAWKQNWKVDAIDNYECIRFIGSELTLNSNKEALYNKVADALRKYRFKRVVMTPYLGNNEGSLYELQSANDTIPLF